MEQNEKKILGLLSALQRVLAKAGARKTRSGAAQGLTNAQIGVMGFVNEHDNCTMSELANDRMVALPAATRMVDGLVSKKLIRRIADEKDRRLVRLSISQKGKEIIGKVEFEAPPELVEALRKMNEDERRALLKSLNLFFSAISETDGEQ